jgi:hypothetical protein
VSEKAIAEEDVENTEGEDHEAGDGGIKSSIPEHTVHTEVVTDMISESESETDEDDDEEVVVTKEGEIVMDKKEKVKLMHIILKKYGNW